jgi:hypothetical protein
MRPRLRITVPPPSQSPHRAKLLAAVAFALISAMPYGALAQESAPTDLRGDTAPEAVTSPATAQDSIDASGAQKNSPIKKKLSKGARKKNSLPSLDAYRGADRLGLRGGAAPVDASAAPAPTIAAIPAGPPMPRPKSDDKPYDPVGITAGDLRLTPSIEEDAGYATNPSLLAGGHKGSPFESTVGEVDLQSDWARNDLHGALRGGYIDYFSDRQANAPIGSGNLDGRLDATHDLSFDGETRFAIAVQTPGSVTLPSGTVLAPKAYPLVETFGGTLGGVEKFGDFSFSLHGLLDRTLYQDATLADGSTEKLSSDDFNDWTLHGRIAYQISPVIAPFVDAAIDARRYDGFTDESGYARDSKGAQASGGVSLAMTQQLTGEASLGYGQRTYQDVRLPDLRGALLNASLIWSATPLTTVALKATTNLADTTTAGASGAVARAYSIDIEHALLRNLILGANVTYSTDDYAGLPINDHSIQFGAHADYSVTRDIVLRATASHVDFVSNLPGSNYTSSVFMLGLKLQR